MRTIPLRAALLALPFLAACDLVESDADAFPQPRHYAAAHGGTMPEGGYMLTFCPDGDALCALGDDIVERGRYTVRDRVITLRGERHTFRLTLSADEDTITYASSPPIVRVPEFQGGGCG